MSNDNSSDIEKKEAQVDHYADPTVLLEDEIVTAAGEHGYDAHRNGRWILDPEEARQEYGEEVANRLKLSPDGKYVLWPQPLGDEDPQAWSERRKTSMLVVASVAAFVPDFSSGVGIAALFPLAAQYETTTSEINNLTSNWSIFLLGWGGLVAVIAARRYGRLPVLFWSQVLGAAFMCGCTFAPDLATFAGMRCLQSFFSTAPQVLGLYVISDIYPVHRQSRAIAIWTLAYLASPFVSPWLFGYLCARQNWRWAYGAGTLLIVLVCIMIAVLGEETIYDRHIRPIPSRPTTGVRYRLESLIGITGFKMRKHRTGMLTSFMDFFTIIWRPQFILLAFMVAWTFGFTIGINVTNPVFLATPKPAGFGLNEDQTATMYLTPIVGAFIGELFARYLCSASAKYGLKKNNGILESAVLLYPTLPGVVLYVIGMVLYGWGNQTHSSLAAIIFGVGLVTLGNLVILVSVLAKMSLDFPGREGVISALINFARVMGGFAVPYFQVIWAEKSGTLLSFGVEGAIVAALWIISVPTMVFFGERILKRFSIKNKAL